VARIARLGEPVGSILWFGACCRSSVVEHSLGKGEVDSSILSGSTRCFHNALVFAGKFEVRIAFRHIQRVSART
jgi:hypothetical protein